MGIEMINIPMTESGPDMDLVEKYVSEDESIKGIWCVPKYSNPTGNTYSDEVVRRLVSMKCAAPDFRIMWDNAYAIHDLSGNGDELLDIFSAAKEYGTEDRVLYFSSTSKVTFPGAGVAMVAASKKNRDRIVSEMSVQTIGYDKMNQLRHLKYFENRARVASHMSALGEKINRKFEIVLERLSALKDEGVASWTVPNGGYFISLDVEPGCAARVFSLMKNAGVTLTPVGATYPYGIDPEDKNLRIAPTFPSDADLSLAVEILVLAVRIAAIEKALA